MDVEHEEMQFLGFLGILRESHKIISTWRIIFAQITLSLILPLAFIFLAHIEVSHFLFRKIIHNEIVLDHTQTGTAAYNRISDLLASEFAYLLLFKLLYFILLIIFSLLSTSAVVYTVACIYTGRELTFKKVMSVVPEVWKRLMVTFLCVMLFLFLYNLVSFLVFFIIILSLLSHYSIRTQISAGFLFFFIHLVGFLYLIIIWQLGYVISVLEDIRGTRALQKSRNLLKGKMVMATLISLALFFLTVIIQFWFQHLVVHGRMLGTMSRIAYGLISLLLVVKVFLLGLVIHTVLYLVCKSYHHENIDKSALSDHLEVYLGDYVPLKSRDVQLERFQV